MEQLLLFIISMLLFKIALLSLAIILSLIKEEERFSSLRLHYLLSKFNSTPFRLVALIWGEPLLLLIISLRFVTIYIHLILLCSLEVIQLLIRRVLKLSLIQSTSKFHPELVYQSHLLLPETKLIQLLCKHRFQAIRLNSLLDRDSCF